jgi:hypothetical protein
MSAASILPTLGSRFTVADSGATNHMFPDKSAFISYKLVSNLQVCMGNNSFLPVLGRGTAIISLNGQRVLVRNALHVLGLVVPLYSLRVHCLQRGCGFIGASSVGILAYFPSFVLMVDTSKDCHLALSLWGARPHSIPSTTFSLAAPQCSIHPNLPLTQPPHLLLWCLQWLRTIPARPRRTRTSETPLYGRTLSLNVRPLLHGLLLCIT